jgi:hypothetical protein
LAASAHVLIDKCPCSGRRRSTVAPVWTCDSTHPCATIPSINTCLIFACSRRAACGRGRCADA